VCNILVPVDGSDDSARAVRFAIRLHARLAKLSVHVLHVRAPRVALRDDSSGRESAEAEATKALASAQALLHAASVPCTGEIASGYVAPTIVACANAYRCDAIVMGTRGMGASGQLPGSIARQVVQLADMPVTLVK
jgi:nucleotide-binding universal stress UspA family protein